MRYRRAIIEGATYFFTVNLADRSRRLLVEQVADLREVVRRVRRDHPFDILAWCVLPEHLHAVWTLPPGDADYPLRWGLIKAGFSRCVAQGEHIRQRTVGWGDEGTPTSTIGGRQCWGSFLTPTYTDRAMIGGT